MASAKEVYLDEYGDEVTREDYQKACEADPTTPVYQQRTTQEPVKTPRAHRRDRRITEVTTQIQKPPVKEKVTEDLKPHPSWFKQNMKYLGAGMLVMAILYIVMVAYVYPAGLYVLNRWNCGQNLICHYDIDVGHNGTSHFVTQYWHDEAIVIELPYHHPEQGKTYALRMPTGEDTPRMVVLHPAYINMHGKPGYPDLEVYVDGFELPAILYNTGSGFSKEQP